MNFRNGAVCLNIEIEGINIHYLIIGTAEKNLLFLHGWGVDTTAYASLLEHLAKTHRVVALDLPGFGKSTEPNAWFTRDYAVFVEKFCQKIGLVEIDVLMGHSFGGKTIIQLVSDENSLEINKIILLDASGVKPKRSFGYYRKVYAFKLMKQAAKLPLVSSAFRKKISEKRANSGSSDYRNASDNLKKTFVQVVNEDLTPVFCKNRHNTLLIWGENDTATPLSDGRLMEKNMPNAGLAVIKHAGHYPFFDNPSQFYAVLNVFLA